jgi:excisionase family DNA binding protein
MTKPVQILPIRERPVCSVEEACALSTLSRRSINTLIASGRIASTKIGARRLVHVRSLLEYITRSAA